MLDPRQLYTYFKQKFVIQKSTNGWYAFSNPFAHDGDPQKKMAVHFGYLWVKSWRRDGYSAHITQFLMDYMNLDYYGIHNKISTLKPSKISLDKLDGLTAPQAEVLRMPDGYSSFIDNDGVLARRAKAYLQKRALDPIMLDQMGIGYCNKSNEESNKNYYGYLLIPFKIRGRLLYYIARDFLGNQLPKYKNPPKEDVGIGKGDLFFNEDALSIHNNVFVLEGAIDAITLSQRAIAMCGNKLTKIQSMKLHNSKAKRFIFIPDVGFYKLWVKMAMPFAEEREVIVINTDNLQDYGKDVNKIVRTVGKYVIWKEIKNTKPLTFTSAMQILGE